MKWRPLKIAFYWILGTFLLLLLVALGFLLYNGISFSESLSYLPNLAERILFSFLSWGILVAPYLLSRLVLYLYYSYKKRGKVVFFKRTALSVVLPCFLLLFFSQARQSYLYSEDFSYEWDHSIENERDSVVNRFAADGKQRGMHYFGRRNNTEEHIKPLLRDNVEWLTFVPFGSQKDYDSPRVGRRQRDYSVWTGRDSAYMRVIQTMQAKGFHIMMKPHVWMHNPSSGKWRSHIKPAGGEAGWQEWAQSYRDFLLHYARMSELLGIETLCIGTELHQTVKDHPQFWEQLIVDLRGMYTGKLTYAANWNEEVDDVGFWSKLDFIGIQAYYPLTKKTEPSIKELKKGWRPHLKKIEALHKKFQRPILFTEIGYKSTPDAAITPWEWADGMNSLFKKVSHETQARCYEAFFQVFWKKDWFAGVHFWEWQAGAKAKYSGESINFTPQYKPAENVMARWFAKDF